MDGMSRNTLPKKERLCGKTGISRLLAKGRHGNVPGLRFCVLSGTGEDKNRIMVSVPKKLFKRAVKRNLLKRRLREGYRQQKHTLNGTDGIDLLITYSTKDILSSEEIHNGICQIIEKVNRMTSPKSSANEEAE